MLFLLKISLMIIGTTKEIKNNEFRVGLNTASVMALTSHGHSVLIETNAGIGSGMSDKDYIAAGATILASAEEVYAKAALHWDCSMLILPNREKISVQVFLSFIKNGEYF